MCVFVWSGTFCFAIMVVLATECPVKQVDVEENQRSKLIFPNHSGAGPSVCVTDRHRVCPCNLGVFFHTIIPVVNNAQSNIKKIHTKNCPPVLLRLSDFSGGYATISNEV